MHDVVVTFVGLETESGITYPYTKVYRLQFETEDQFLLWEAAAESFGAVHKERMKAEED